MPHLPTGGPREEVAEAGKAALGEAPGLSCPEPHWAPVGGSGSAWSSESAGKEAFTRKNSPAVGAPEGGPVTARCPLEHTGGGQAEGHERREF